MSRSLFSLLCGGFIIVNCAEASDSSRLCGADTLSKNTTICFRYYPGRALELTSPGKKVEYTITKENSPRRYVGGDLIVDDYGFEPAVKNAKVTMNIRIVEAARYPGDGEYETLTLEGTTQDGVKFLVKSPK